jgi:hypothetical protein
VLFVCSFVRVMAVDGEEGGGGTECRTKKREKGGGYHSFITNPQDDRQVRYLPEQTNTNTLSVGLTMHITDKHHLVTSSAKFIHKICNLND